MMNPPYKDMFLSKIAAAIGAAKAAADITHTGVKGRIREILVGDLFRSLLPADLGVGSGQIVTYDGQISSEQDVVIYDRRILPPVLFGEGGLGLFPVECVLATVEVKTTLTAQELKGAHDSAASIRHFAYLSGARDPLTDRVVGHEIRNAVAAVLALETDLTGTRKSEVERYMDLNPDADPPLKAICVSGRGYWYFQDGEWRQWSKGGPYAETCAFVVGLFDLFPVLRASRRQPKLAEYLF